MGLSEGLFYVEGCDSEGQIHKTNCSYKRYFKSRGKALFYKLVPCCTFTIAKLA